MTSWGGKTITSDAIGNMLSDGTWTYTWEHGRELASMSSGGTTWNFTYDANGMRTQRTDGTTTYSYVYNGGQLSQMTIDAAEDVVLNFTYDASGTPLSVVYNGTYYYYVTDLQGDVVAIVDTAGVKVVEYLYDAWGRLLETSGTKAADLGLHNPLRYRGYVYDTETGLYYLQSRYYNPTLGRFLSSDVIYDTDAGLQGFNLFLYCGNNPTNRIDASGADSNELSDGEDMLDKALLEGGGASHSHNPSSGGTSSGYVAPPGGGGITNKYTIGDTTVEFGHGGRHLDGTGLSVDQVEPLIAQDVVNAGIPVNRHHLGQVNISGVTIVYSSYHLSERRYNVGTYYPVHRVNQ